MEFPKDFFEDEIRDGYYIPTITKKVWANQMEVLEVVRKICEKHDIKYFVYYGTLLGTIRHAGSIPWDDDIDIAMLREDYTKFCEIIESEKPKEYYFENLHNKADERDVMGAFANNNKILTEPEYVKAHHGCIFAVGVDIFPLDFLPDDLEERAKEKQLVELIYGAIAAADAGASQKTNLRILLAELESKTGFRIKQEKNIGQQLMIFLEQTLASVKNQKQVTIYPTWLEHPNYEVDVTVFEDIIWMPYEHIQVPVPAHYITLMQRYLFRDFMHCVRGWHSHGYPFFEKQIEILRQHAQVPEYRFDLQVVNERLQERVAHEQAREQNVRQYEEIANLFVRVKAAAQDALDKGDAATAQMLLDKLQSIAPTLDGLQKKVNPEKQLVVFVPWKARFWNTMDATYRKYAQDPDTEVVVIPCPYYRLVDTEVTQPHVDMEGYPEDVSLTYFEEFDWEANRPDIIFFQNPWDEWNEGSVPKPSFFSKQLQRYTDCLVMIPWFFLDDFEMQDERAVKMMNIWATKPGFVYADAVFLQSEKLRTNLVECLTKWAGSSTKEIWEEKLIADADLEESAKNSLDACFIPYIETTKSEENRKELLYYISPGRLYEESEKMPEKIRRTLDIFRANREKLWIRWYEDPQMLERLSEDLPELAKQYECLQKEFEEEALGFVDRSGNAPRAAYASDAFYGDEGYVTHLAIRLHKMCMIENVDI